MDKLKLCYVILAVVFAASCSSTKNLKDNQRLYTGAEVNIHSTANISKKQKKEIKTELESLARPKPNSKVLGMPVKLWVYNFAGTPEKKGLRHWLKYKVGEAPVLYSQKAAEKNRAVFQNRLENRGYFHDTVTLDTISKNKKIKSVYTAEIGKQYTIAAVSFPNDSGALAKQIQKIKKWSFLKKGRPYDLDVIKNERDRIDKNLKQHGYYYFSPDYLFMKVDSTVGNQQVNIDVRIKAETASKAKEQYRINDVVVYADYDIQSDTNLTTNNAIKYSGYTIVDPEQKFQPKIFSRALIFKPGDLYKRKDHDLSLNRLITLGVYKFVKVWFEDVDTVKGNYLNAFYYLTPTDKKSIRFEASAITKSNSSNGGELSVTWKNRNLLKGAELLTVSVYGGMERQILNSSSRVYTNRLGTDVNLYVPRILSPFRFETNSGFVPKTVFNPGFEFYNRTDQYTLTSSHLNTGYVWKENVKKEHQLNVIAIAYVRPSNITDSFQRQLDTNLALARSIERQFIIGSSYNFNYNSQNEPNYRKNNFYFNGSLELSGNLIGLIGGANINKGKTISLFNTPISQFIRTQVEFRHYLRFGKYNMLASRAIGGIGYAYGNSNTMPFVKEFFAGGTSDIRAFSSRSLGPGSYYGGNPKVVGYLPEQPGDIKIEANTEYRAKLFSVVRGALFIDAGNTWTVREDSLRPGAKFSNAFLSEVAVGVGAGLRLDFNIIVLRLDAAFPVRKPYLPSGSRWVFDEINFGSSDWRKENLVFNLAIGYPF